MNAKKEGNAGRILIVGATGFVGKHMVAALCRKHKLRALVRQSSRKEDIDFLVDHGCELAYGDAHDLHSLEEAMRGCGTVVHLVGIIVEHPKEGITFERMHVASTRNIVAAAHTAGVRRLVYFSALGTGPYADNQYHQTKYQAEQIVKASRIPFIIFRPAVIAGKGDRSINLFARLVRRMPIVPVIAPQAVFQPIFVDDLMACVARSLSERRFLNKVHEVCGPDALTLGEIFKVLARVQGKRRLFIPMPMAVARLVAFFGQAMRNPPLTPEQLKMLKHPNVCRFEDAQKEFGVRFTPFKAAVSTYLV